jgi:hypothetical protein
MLSGFESAVRSRSVRLPDSTDLSASRAGADVTEDLIGDWAGKIHSLVSYRAYRSYRPYRALCQMADQRRGDRISRGRHARRRRPRPR